MSTTSSGAGPLHTLMKEMIAGLPTLPPSVTSLTILGKTYSLADLGTKLATYDTTYAAAVKAEADFHTAVEARVAIETDAQEFVHATKAALKVALGRKAAVLENVGLTPDKTPAPLTTEQKAARNAKAAATRAARHTVGPKAKSKIKGQVPPAPPAPPTPPKPGP